MNVLLSGLRGVVWDWGDTLMRDIPGQVGPPEAADLIVPSLSQLVELSRSTAS